MTDGRLTLTLDDLSSGATGVTPAYGRSLAEAAGVCLDDQEHANPIRFHIPDIDPQTCDLTWPTISERTRLTWNDDEDATEHGAMAIALLFTIRFLGYRIVGRMKKGKGVDFLLARSTSDASEEPVYLEVSGIRHGNAATIQRRLKEKLQQTEKLGGAGLAHVIVVEFSRPVARFDARNPAP